MDSWCIVTYDSCLFMEMRGWGITPTSQYYKLYCELYFIHFIHQNDGDMVDHEIFHTPNGVGGV